MRRYEIMQRFIEGIRSFELKRNFALMYAQEQYVDTPPRVEDLRFTVQQYFRMRGLTRAPAARTTRNYKSTKPDTSSSSPSRQRAATSTATAASMFQLW